MRDLVGYKYKQLVCVLSLLFILLITRNTDLLSTYVVCKFGIAVYCLQFAKRSRAASFCLRLRYLL